MSSPTSLQSVLSDRAAVDSEAGSCVRSHLDLVLCPDDQILQQTVVRLWAADVLLLVVPWQPCQTVSTHTETPVNQLDCRVVQQINNWGLFSPWLLQPV